MDQPSSSTEVRPHTKVEDRTTKGETRTGLTTDVILSGDEHDASGITPTAIVTWTQIFIGQLHPDHCLGLQILKEASADAEVIGQSEYADGINGSCEFTIEHR